MRNLSDSAPQPKGRWTRLLTSLVLGLALTPVAGTADPNPYEQSDETWISISGTVDTVEADTFTLDYGNGAIIVEMDDGDRDADAYSLLKGDKVTVTGRVDKGFFESTTIEASSVYVENLGTTFFASSVDEEERESIIASAWTPVVIARTEVRGTVTEVNGEEFILDTGDRMVRVDVGTLSYNPLDDDGYQRIDVGDRVKVIGWIDTDLFEGRELKAESLIELYQATS